MESDIQALRITHDELDQLTGLDVGGVFMGGVIRPSVWRSRRRMLSLFITECLVLGTLFVVCFGLVLVLVRQREGFDQLGLLLVGMAGAIALGAIAWHFYQWRRAKTLITLARLLDECDRHNEIIQAVQVMAELENAQRANPGQNGEILVALQATRDSLISALMTEKIMRRHRALMQRRQELFGAIEANLVTLQALQVNHQASEYRQFLQEALNIGLAVQREIGQRD